MPKNTPRFNWAQPGPGLGEENVMKTNLNTVTNKGKDVFIVYDTADLILNLQMTSIVI